MAIHATSRQDSEILVSRAESANAAERRSQQKSGALSLQARLAKLMGYAIVVPLMIVMIAADLIITALGGLRRKA